MTPFDLASDCTLLDGSETVSVALLRPEGRTTITINGALRRALARSERAFDGVTLQGDEITGHIPDGGFVDGQELQPGDTITAGSEVWSIITVRRETLGTRWRCACRKEP